MFTSVTLEMSLKPFKKTDEQYIRRVSRTVFEQWRPLIKNRKEISIMLWVADGSEILDYDGDMNKAFEWACYLGTANNELLGEDEDPATSLHHKKQMYIKNPPIMTYAILKNIVRILRETGNDLYPNAKIRIGETFDIGPEFAVSDFKYKRHTEICTGSDIANGLRFIDSTALLNEDHRAYAAYPNGIPQDTPLAVFLGRQIQVFFKDMGFDYLWLSNGLGFSADPWATTGKIYDGNRFYLERLKDVRRKVFLFWEMFRQVCPDIPIETRGTNNSVGIDYASDGVPLYGLYKSDFNFLPPPNSPWAAINGDYGLEIMGHMSRICDLPNKDFLFRYYLHDPWWANSPWYDRYDGCASDIYLPMSVSRIDESGKIQSASRFNILSIDNSFGDMPEACVNEPIPHFLKAEKDMPEETFFLVWLYPMKEYSEAQDEELLREMRESDLFIAKEINNGLPLNCVVSMDNFKKTNLSLYKEKIILSPIIRDKETLSKLQDFANEGGKIIFYGTSEYAKENSVSGENVIFVDIEKDGEIVKEGLEKFGYSIYFQTKEENCKLPVLGMVRANNGIFLSVYNPSTTSDTFLRFPLGAPILLGGETEIENGYAKYRFSRAEHRECRIFIKQDSGVISAHETTPGAPKYRRRFYVKGLKNATVYYFPESYCMETGTITKTDWGTPELMEGWEKIKNPVFGTGYKAENQNGCLYFLMLAKQYV